MGDLSNAMQNLVDDIKSSAETRHAAVGELMDETVKFMGSVRVKVSEVNSDTHNLLERFRLEHRDMATALKEELPSDETARSEATQQFMDDARSDVAVDKEATQDLLKRFHSKHRDMTAALNEKLSSDEAARSEAIHPFIDGLASDRREAQNIWRGRSAEIAAVPAPEPIAEEEPVEKQLVEEAAPEPITEEEPVEEAASEPIIEEKPSPEDRVLEVIAEHSEGIRLVDIGNELGVDWRGLIATVKPLVDEDRVEKIDSLYYPKS